MSDTNWCQTPGHVPYRRVRLVRERTRFEVVHGTAGQDFIEALDRACEEGARFLVDQWGFSMEEAFVFLSVACDANICQACRPQPFSTIARIAIPKIAAAPRPFA